MATGLAIILIVVTELSEAALKCKTTHINRDSA